MPTFSRSTVLYALSLLLCAMVFAPIAAVAQDGNGDGDGEQDINGIRIDADGVVRPVYVPERAARLHAKRMEAFASDKLPAELNRHSPLRKISLVRLEEECVEYAERGEPTTMEMNFLAGLQRIDYVFVYPEQGDLVIAGPAEGFAPSPVGRAVGLSTGRPPLRLDDLIVALRSIGDGHSSMGCSIDPVQERVAAVQRFGNMMARSPASVAVAKSRYRKMADLLGLQNVRVWGVPEDSHFARALVEADYRLKRVSMGLDDPGVPGFRSHLSMLKPGGNAMQRWWFTPRYDAIYCSEDGDAFELAGQRVQLNSEQEAGSGTAGATTRQFAAHFTQKFPALADNVAVFAELQNLFDLAIVAALLKKESLPQKVDWPISAFLDPELIELRKEPAPQRIESVTNYRMDGNRMVIGLLGGGLRVRPVDDLAAISIRSGEPRRLTGMRHQANAVERPGSSSWWWD